MERAVKAGLPKGVAPADAAYGNVGEFRAGLRWLDFEYAVGVNANTVVTRASKAAIDPSPMSVETLVTASHIRAPCGALTQPGTMSPMHRVTHQVRVLDVALPIALMTGTGCGGSVTAAARDASVTPSDSGPEGSFLGDSSYLSDGSNDGLDAGTAEADAGLMDACIPLDSSTMCVTFMPSYTNNCCQGNWLLGVGCMSGRCEPNHQQ